MAREVTKAGQAKKEELTARWNELSGRLPTAVAGLGEKIDALEASRTLPSGFDAARLAAARTWLDEVKAMWTGASTRTPAATW